MDAHSPEGIMSALDTLHEPKRIAYPIGTVDQQGRTKKECQISDTVPLTDNIHPGKYVKISDNLTVYAIWYKKYQCYIAVRKLTPRECFRLQGWTDDYFEKAEFVNNNSQLYKQAGNGVTVNVVYEIAKAMNEYEKE